MYRPTKIISGGQTGADMGGLLAAHDLDIETGGWAPKGWRTEAGPNPALGVEYGLIQASSDSYPYRTGLNISDCDGTAIWGDNLDSPGSKLTLSQVKEYGVPYILNPNAEQLREWCEGNKIEVLNIAGNRESKCAGIEERVRAIVVKAFM